MKKQATQPVQAPLLRSSTGALLFSCVIVALCPAINLAGQSSKAIPPQDNASFGPNAHRSAASLPASANQTLSFTDRVAYQRAIEDVYWRHRIWPKERPDPKPALDAVVSQAQLEKKVADYLRNSQALEDYWQRPLTAEQLQSEMERMASHTKQPDVLREIFEALGNDPFVIAECLARPVLAERLVRELNNQEKVTAIDSSPKAFAVQVLQRMRSNGQAFHRPYQLPVIGSPSGGCIDDTWTPTTLTNAPTGRAGHTAVWTGSEMIVWGGDDPNWGYLNTGGKVQPRH